MQNNVKYVAYAKYGTNTQKARINILGTRRRYMPTR